MGVIAPTGEKQALASELTEAGALIEAGEFGAALDRLKGIRGRAGEQRDVRVLGEAAEMARRVRGLSSQGTAIADRAEWLVRSVAWELDPDTADAGGSQKREVPLMKLVVWTLLVWVPILVLMVLAPSEDCTGDRFCFAPSAGDILAAFALIVAFPVYGIGVLVILLWERRRR